MPVMKLLSLDARNRAAAASSSGRPSRPMGVAAAKEAFAASACSFVLNCPSMIGVSVAPGLNVLTRIPRSLSSVVHVLAKERTAALVATYTPGARRPLPPTLHVGRQ